MTLNGQVETVTLSVYSLGKIFTCGAVRLKSLTEILKALKSLLILHFIQQYDFNRTARASKVLAKICPKPPSY